MAPITSSCHCVEDSVCAGCITSRELSGMLDLEEEFGPSERFEKEYEAAGQDVGNSSTNAYVGHDITEDGKARTRSKYPLDGIIAEEVGYDEDYSDADIALYTPTVSVSPTRDSSDLVDVPLLENLEQSDKQIGTERESDASSPTTPEAAPKDSLPGSHRSALPGYLTGLPQLTLSAVFAQGRRGSTPANDKIVPEDLTNYFTANDTIAMKGSRNYFAASEESDFRCSDINSTSKRYSTTEIPTIVDIVAQYRASIRDEWDRVFQDDASDISNPYYWANHWDRDALDNYTRFPRSRRRPASVI
ncbi:hypothetical protein PMIN03_008150 [Paraphaeosphaeria minitans]